MLLAFALSPFLVLGAGALLLMLAEAFASPAKGRRGIDADESANGIALGTTIVFLAGGAFAGGIWMYGIDNIDGLATVAPWLLIDRFTVFFEMLLCLGGAFAALQIGRASCRERV